MLRLSDLPASVGMTVVRDGAFASLGYVDHHRPAMLHYLESAAYLEKVLAHPQAACVVTTEALASEIPERLGCAVSPAPSLAFYHAHNHLADSTDFYGAPSPNRIDASARIHPTAWIAEHDVAIGANVEIGPFVSVFPKSVIEDDVIIRAGAVVGGEGFQFKKHAGGVLSVRHAGGVHLHRRVEIQQNTCIDRSVFGGMTEIGEDTKIDNLVHVAHDVRIGKRALVVALCMLGGSTEIGDDVWVGPHGNISSVLKIGDGARVTLGSTVTRDVPAGQTVSGNFAIEHAKFLKFIKSIAK